MHYLCQMNRTGLHNRLASLDILRGLDLFLLLFLQPVLISWLSVNECSSLDWLRFHLDHEVWQGFRAWDLVMPLFLFMVGTSMPFSFAKYTSGKSRPAIYRKIARRVLILFLFGMIVQGNLLALDISKITIYTNTLQAIAIGYLIAAIIILNLPFRLQPVAALILLIVYAIPMHICGDFTPENSFAFKVDRIILGNFRGDLSYTWIWSSINFGVTVLLGTFAGQIMKNAGAKKRQAAATMLIIGIILTVAGLLWNTWMPIIKRLWTSSMVLYSGGLCFILMALFYYVIDCLNYSYGLNWLKIYGTNPITAYILGEVINFRSIVSSLSFGLEQYLGEYYQVWLTFGNFAILFLILYFMNRFKIYLKI